MMKLETFAYPANVTLVKPFLVRQETCCSSYRIYFLCLISVHSLEQMVKPFLEPKTYRKVTFAYPDNPRSRTMMEELFDMDKLESCFGGKNTAGMNFEAYGQKMREDDKKMIDFIDSCCSTSEANEVLQSRNDSDNESSGSEAVYSNLDEDEENILKRSPYSEYEPKNEVHHEKNE